MAHPKPAEKMKYPHINNETLRLWTIQPLSIYEELLEKGEFAVFDSEFAKSDPKHLQGYEWLIKQMQRRIGESPYPNQYPIWAWFQYENFKRNKPDMRSYSLPKGEKHVRLTIELAKSDVLLSDFDKWHNVFSYQIPVIGSLEFLKSIPDEDLPYLGYGDDLFPDLPKKYQNLIMSTWTNIFDLNIGKSWHSKSIQATFWTLKLSDVKKVEHFTGRYG